MNNIDINVLDDYSSLESEAKYRSFHRNGLKLLTPK